MQCECDAYSPDATLLACTVCGCAIDAHRHLSPIDPTRAEPAADRIVSLCKQLGLSRDEVGVTLLAVAVNHLVATGVTEQRVVLAAAAMHRWRTQRGQNERVLVPPPMSTVGGV